MNETPPIVAVEHDINLMLQSDESDFYLKSILKTRPIEKTKISPKPLIVERLNDEIQKDR